MGSNGKAALEKKCSTGKRVCPFNLKSQVLVIDGLSTIDYGISNSHVTCPDSFTWNSTRLCHKF